MPHRQRPARTDLLGRNRESVKWELDKLRKTSIKEKAAQLFDLIESVRKMQAATAHLRERR